MKNLSARHELVCAIVQRYPDAAVALAEAVGVPLPEYDQVMASPDAHRLRSGSTVHTDATVRLLQKGRPVFFMTVEMQRDYKKGKYATLHAYHGSGVRNIDAGGHLFVLSDKPGATAQFRSEDAGRRAALAFSGSFHSGGDLEKLRDVEDLSLGARAMPAAMADLSAGVPGWAREVLEELSVGDLTLADLYFQTMLEEVPKMTMVGEALRPELLERLRELESFRDYEARVKAEADAEAEARVEARVEATTQAKVAEAKAEDLKDFLILRGDAPSEYAINTITTCRNPALLSAWLKRAYLGATSAQLFPEPKESKDSEQSGA